MPWLPGGRLMSRMWFLGLVASLFVWIAPAPPLLGQPAAPAEKTAPAADQVTVATRVLAPFVTRKKDAYDGFSVELWTAIAQELNLKFTWTEVPTVSDLLASVGQGKAQVAIAAISITAAREEKFDFSQPMFESGLQIMVRSDGSSGLSLAQIWGMLTSGTMPVLLGILAALIIIPAHIMWLWERSHSHAIVSRAYFPGIFHAIWWATGAAAGQQLDYPRSAFGRAISAVAILVSVVFLAYFTAAVTSAMTIQQLKGDIDGPEDLPGKRIGTTAGSTSAAYLAPTKAVLTEFARIEQAFAALADKQVDAVVFDAPVLLYHASNEGKGKARVVGPIFRKENYGILFPQDSALRKRVNEALLKLRENGTYDTIYTKWFSAQQTSGSN
jgi:polar amino acid transport system substrate-binding protein